MKKILLVLVSLVSIISVRAQYDLSVISITQPASSCALTATENVTIRIFNFGITLPAGTSFNVSYTINAGAPVTEIVVLPSNLLSNSTFNYTFTTQANLSTPGSYTFSATSNIPGDVNPTNNTFTGYIVSNTAPSVGGTVAGGTNVCTGSNSGTLTLSDQTGNVLRWEYSTDGGSNWITISNTTNTLSYSNLTTTTQYRAVVQNGACATALSSVAVITVDPASVGGTVSGGTTVCSGVNSGALTLTGRTGNVVRWQFSIDGGVTWSNIADASTSQNYSNLTISRIYRAEVQSGACSSTFSSLATVTVNPVTVGGTLTPATNAECAGSANGNLTLSGYTGNITRWESSIDNGLTWSNVTNTTSTYSYNNLSASTLFRARVQSSPCGAAYSGVASVTVTQFSGGTLSATGTTCAGANSGNLTLSGYLGNIIQWESSVPQSGVWDTIVNTTSAQSYNNLTANRLYRVLVQNGPCPGVYSSTFTVVIDSASVGGQISPDFTQACQLNNNSQLDLQNYTGNVVQWESSIDGGTTWAVITNASASQPYSALNTTTHYRALVQNVAQCPSAYSDTAVVQIDSATAAGHASGDTVVCAGVNGGAIYLAGYTGSITAWQQSADGGSTWNTINNTNSQLSYSNLLVNTQYRAVVQSGVCPAQNSNVVLVQVSAASAGGGISPSLLTVCSSANSGAITLSGNTGNVIEWQTSADGGATWASINNTLATQNYANLTGNTLYKVVVQNGACAPTESPVATINTVAATAPGIVTPTATSVCVSGNAGNVLLQGQTGQVIQWETSADNGITWDTINNNTAVQAFANLSGNTLYKVLVQNSPCPAVYSANAAIGVDVPAQGGVVSSAPTVCAGSNGGSLTLTGNTGDVVRWEISYDYANTWLPVANTDTFQTYLNLPDTTLYRVLVQNGSCGTAYSAAGSVNAASASNGGAILPADTSICGGVDSGQLSLSGYTGNVLQWQSSTDGGVTWVAINNTETQFTYSNVTTATWYRAVVQNAVCDSAYSLVAQVSPDSATAAFAYTINGLSVSFFNLSNNAVQYHWSFDDTATATGSDPTHTYATAGTYNVTLTAIGKCDTNAVTQTIVIGPTGLNDATVERFNVYPNPLENGMWTLECGKDMVGENVEIFDAGGRIVFRSSITTTKPRLNFEAAKGVYYLRISGLNGVVKKLVRL